MPNYDFVCKECGTDSVHNVKYEKRDETQPCSECGGESVRVYLNMPGIRTEKLSASFVDGQKRPGFDRLRRHAALDLAEAEAKGRDSLDDYKEIQKEKAGRIIKDK